MDITLLELSNFIFKNISINNYKSATIAPYRNRVEITLVYNFENNCTAMTSYELRIFNNKVFIIKDRKVVYYCNNLKKIIGFINKVFKDLKKAKIK